MRHLSLVVVLGLLAGCVAYGTRVGEEQVTQFERGRTSYFDVVSTLGRPTTMLLHADGTREVTYFYSQSQLKAVNFVPLLAALQQQRTDQNRLQHKSADGGDDAPLVLLPSRQFPEPDHAARR